MSSNRSWLRLLAALALLRLATSATAASCISFTVLSGHYASQPVDCSSMDLLIVPGGILFVGGSGATASFDAGLLHATPTTTTTNRGQILVSDGSRFTNNMVLSNEALMSNGGQLVNEGLFYNQISGVITSSSTGIGATLRNNGDAVNLGVIDVVSGGFVNSGTFTNGGTVNQRGQASNYGSIRLSSGDFNNSGSFDNWGGFGVADGARLLNTGSFVNQPGGSFVNQSTVTLDVPTLNHGEWSNEGLLQVNAPLSGSGNYDNRGTWMLNGPNGRLTVEGMLTNEGQMLVGAGSQLSILQGGSLLLYYGTLRIEGELSLDAPVWLSAGTPAPLLDLAGGTVHNRSDFLIDRGATLTSRSDIVNQRNVVVDGQLELMINAAEQHGHFINQEGAVLSVTQLGTLIVGSSVQNQGQLQTEGVVRLAGGSINNLGLWVNTGTVDLRDASATPPLQGTGTYVQNDGLFQLNGDAYQSSFLFHGGRVCGTATLHGTVDLSGATVCPGNSPGTMRFANGLTMSAGTLEMEIAGAGDGQFDRLIVDGDLLISGGSLHVVFLGGFVPQAGAHFELLSASGVLSGWEHLAQQIDGLPAGLTGGFSLGSGGLEWVVMTSTVPEPNSGAALLAGLAVIGWVARRSVAGGRRGCSGRS